MMTGYSLFQSLPAQTPAAETPSCHACGAADDTAEHPLAYFPSWDRRCDALVAQVGQDISLSRKVRAMLASDEAWKAFTDCSEHVMAAKEAANCEREAVLLKTRATPTVDLKYAPRKDLPRALTRVSSA